MDIKLYGGSRRNDGFGVAGRKIAETLTKQGHQLLDGADVHLTFAHPHQFDTGGRYNIGYFPWESTLPADYTWLQKMDAMDEIWVTSPWMQRVVADWGFDSFVYPHGTEAFGYRDRTNKTDGTLRFLHMGWEAIRKGGGPALSAFRKAFPGDEDVELIIKTQRSGIKYSLPKVRFIDENLSHDQLMRLRYVSDCFVMPTYGEGFGLPGLDAIATGMPIIATGGFLPYEYNIHVNNVIDSKLIVSPWPDTHPGLVYEPNVDDLVDRYRDMYNNYDAYAYFYEHNCWSLSRRYSWDKVTRDSFSALGKRLG